MATLIDSSRNYSHLDVLVYETDAAADKLIEAIYKMSREQASARLQIKDGRYMYTPSNDYTTNKQRFIRAKFHKL
jgi:hypothetical protein